MSVIPVYQWILDNAPQGRWLVYSMRTCRLLRCCPRVSPRAFSPHLPLLLLQGDVDLIVPFTGSRAWIKSMALNTVVPFHAWNTPGQQVRRPSPPPVPRVDEAPFPLPSPWLARSAATRTSSRTPRATAAACTSPPCAMRATWCRRCRRSARCSSSHRSSRARTCRPLIGQRDEGCTMAPQADSRLY